MSKYLLIQSKSPWESGDIAQFSALARDLENAGGEVIETHSRILSW